MKNPNSLWIDILNGTWFVGDPAAKGYKEDGCGPDFLSNAEGNVERVVALKVHVAACDGNFTKRFKSLAAASEYCRAMGFRNDGGVCEYGCSRYDGVEYRVGNSKTWFACPSGLDEAVRMGGES